MRRMLISVQWEDASFASERRFPEPAKDTPEAEL